MGRSGWSLPKRLGRFSLGARSGKLAQLGTRPDPPVRGPVDPRGSAVVARAERAFSPAAAIRLAALVGATACLPAGALASRSGRGRAARRTSARRRTSTRCGKAAGSAAAGGSRGGARSRGYVARTARVDHGAAARAVEHPASAGHGPAPTWQIRLWIQTAGDRQGTCDHPQLAAPRCQHALELSNIPARRSQGDPLGASRCLDCGGSARAPASPTRRACRAGTGVGLPRPC